MMEFFRQISGLNCWLKWAVLGAVMLGNATFGRAQNAQLVAVDSSGTFWAGRMDGLFRLDSSGVSQRIMFDPADSMRVSGPSISAVCTAEDGRLWIGTVGSGLHLFDPKTRSDTRFRHVPGQLANLPSDTILAIFRGKKEFWVATPQGLSKWLAPLDLFRTFRPSPTDIRKFVPFSIGFDEKRPNAIWLPTDGGAFLFDKKTETLRFFTLPNARPEMVKVPVSMPVLPMMKDTANLGNDSVSQKKMALWLLFSLVGVGGIFWIFQRIVARIRRQEQLKFTIRESENQLLRSQMNPQFIFNSLTSIKNHILSNEKILAADYLSGFALLLKNILDHSRTERIPLSDELDTLRLYVSLEQLRFKKKFDFELRVDPQLPQQDLLVQPLILQPFVENAIRHGLQNKEGKGYLLVEILKKNDLLVYKIEDNGPSRARREAIRAATASPAEELQITRDRLMLHQKDASVEWIDLADEASEKTGTRVEVVMKMQTENTILL